MKKIFLMTMAVFAISACSVLMSSCSKDGDEPSKSNEIELPVPKYEGVAKKVIFDEPIKIGSAERFLLKGVEVTESGKFIAASVPALENRAGGTEHIITGVYVCINDIFTITADDLNGGKPFEMKIADDGTVTIGGVSFKGKLVKGPAANALTSKICRTWRLSECKVDGAKVDLAKRKEFSEIGYPKELTITKSGTVLLTFSTGKTEIATWDWQGSSMVINHSTLTYAIDMMSFSFVKNVTLSLNIDGTNFVFYIDAV